MNVRKIAQQLFYTGKSDLIPNEEEERELTSRWGMEFPYGDTFTRQVSELTGGKSTPEAVANQYEEIVDAIEEHFNIDVDNVDIQKYSKLASKLEELRSFVLRKIENSSLDPLAKMTAEGNIKSMKSTDAILLHLYYRSTMPF